MNVPERIIDQIRKLRALAESPNEHEAASAAAFAQNLLIKYNLTLMDIPTEMREKNPVGEERFAVGGGKGSTYRWKVGFLNSIAYCHFCKAILAGTRDHQMIIVGRTTDREVVFFLFNTLCTTLETLASALPKRNPEGTPPATWGPQKSFLFGAVETITERLREQWLALSKPSAENNTKALVVISDKAIKTYINEKYRLQSGGGLGDHDRPNGEAYEAGREAGRRVAINKGVRAGSPGMRQISG